MDLPTTSASVALDYKHQLHAEALACARLMVKGCCRFFRSHEAGVQYILDAASEVADEVVGAAAENTFRFYCRLLWIEEEALEQRWTERTTNDAIDEAFVELAKRGVVALQNVGGTTSMGWPEVNDAIAKLERRKKKVIGGVFYHSQDTERAIEGAGVSLAFGARDGSDEGARHLAEIVMKALRAEGVECEWSGDIDTRLRILPFEWRKRRTTKAPRKLESIGWRVFWHPDGRRWEIAGLNNQVCIKITDTDGEVVPRRRASRNLKEDITEIVAAQLADGFVEHDRELLT